MDTIKYVAVKIENGINDIVDTVQNTLCDMMGINITPRHEEVKPYTLSRIKTFFKDKLDSQYILKSSKDSQTLYTSELDERWWKAKAPLMSLKSTGDGFVITHRPGNVNNKFKKFELSYSDAEYLLILLKAENLHNQKMKHHKSEY